MGLAPDGSVQGAWWFNGPNWTRYQLAPAGSASPAGPITSVSRRSEAMEVWWIAPNGSVQGAYWYEGDALEALRAGARRERGAWHRAPRGGIPHPQQHGGVVDCARTGRCRTPSGTNILGPWSALEIAPAGSAPINLAGPSRRCPAAPEQHGAVVGRRRMAWSRPPGGTTGRLGRGTRLHLRRVRCRSDRSVTRSVSGRCA